MCKKTVKKKGFAKQHKLILFNIQARHSYVPNDKLGAAAEFQRCNSDAVTF